jgi:hypothetical protein
MLDPQRVKLDAANIGFLVRTGQKVDMDKVKMFLQTDDSGCSKVRREAETPVNELHVMGGQRFGLEGNMNLQDYTRQARQMNGYPLRSFSSNAPAVILPPKYGGFPQFVQNESERTDYVSRFTEPMSAPLQQNTILLGKQGYTVTSNSASDPFQPLGFDMNMFQSKDAIDANEYQHKLKQYLERVENRRVANMSGGTSGKGGKSGPFGGYSGAPGMTGMGGIGGDIVNGSVTTSQKALQGGFKGRSVAPRIGVNDGVFIGSDGKIMTQVSSVTNNAFMTQNVFTHNDVRYQANIFHQGPPAQNDSGIYNLPSNRALEGPVDLDILDDNQNLETHIPQTPGLRNQELVQTDYYHPSASNNNGLQPRDLMRTPPVPTRPANNYASPLVQAVADYVQDRPVETSEQRRRRLRSRISTEDNDLLRLAGVYGSPEERPLRKLGGTPDQRNIIAGGRSARKGRGRRNRYRPA